jgi:hypothetical protein
MVASSLIKSPRLQLHLDVDVEKLVGAVWFLRTSSGCGIFRSSWSFFVFRAMDARWISAPVGGRAPFP